MLKIVVALILLGHGLGHSMGPLQAFKVATVNPAWNGDSWILSGVAGPTVTQLVGVVVWTAALVGFVVLAGVVVGWLPITWWPPVAIASAVASMVGLLLFPAAFPPAQHRRRPGRQRGRARRGAVGGLVAERSPGLTRERVPGSAGGR